MSTSSVSSNLQTQIVSNFLENPKRPFLYVPDALTKHVFTFLNPIEFTEIIKIVSTHWLNLSNHPKIIQHQIKLCKNHLDSTIKTPIIGLVSLLIISSLVISGNDTNTTECLLQSFILSERQNIKFSASIPQLKFIMKNLKQILDDPSSDVSLASFNSSLERCLPSSKRDGEISECNPLEVIQSEESDAEDGLIVSDDK